MKKEALKKIFILFFITISLLIAVNFVYAQESLDINEAFYGDTGKTAEDLAAEAGLGTLDPRVIAARIINIALGFLGIIALGLIIYAGFMWMTAGGNADQIGKAKKILIGAGIGLILVLASFGIATFILRVLLGATGGGGGTPGTPVTPPAYPEQFLLSNTYPANNAANVERNVKIEFIFNSPPKADTVNLNSFTLTALDKDDHAVILNPANPVTSGNSITVESNTNPSDATCTIQGIDYPCFPADINITVTAENENSGILRVDGKQLTCDSSNPCSITFTVGDHFKLDNPIGAACAKDLEVPAYQCSENGSLCVTEYCETVYNNQTACEAAGYGSGVADCCLCQGAPVIDYVSPDDGLCIYSGLPAWATPPVNRTCLISSDCTYTDDGVLQGGERDFEGVCSNINAEGNPAPNGAVGNMVTIGGRWFGEYDNQKSKLYFNCSSSADSICTINIGDSWFLEAQLAGIQNTNCGTTWTDNEIIVIVPDGAIEGPIIVKSSTENTDATNDDRGPSIEDFVVNNIERPGLCKIEPDYGEFKDKIVLHGINFGDNQNNTPDPPLDANKFKHVVFGGGSEPISSLYQENFSWSDILIGVLPAPPPISETNPVTDGPMVPNIAPSPNVPVRVKSSGGVPGNSKRFQVNRSKLAPHITNITPKVGHVGDYITVVGSNFGSTKGELKFIIINTEYNGDFTFPPECSSNAYWKDDQIIVKVPAGVSGNDIQIKVIESVNNFDDIWGDNTGEDKFAVRNYCKNDHSVTCADDSACDTGETNTCITSAVPGLCKIEPANGIPDQTNVDFYGERFGIEQGDVKFYNDQSASPTNWKQADPDKFEADYANAVVPANAQTGDVSVARANGTISNPMFFTVGSCLDDSSSPIDGFCVEPNQYCCPAGSANSGSCTNDYNNCGILAGSQYAQYYVEFSTASDEDISCDGDLAADLCQPVQICDDPKVNPNYDTKPWCNVETCICEVPQRPYVIVDCDAQNDQCAQNLPSPSPLTPTWDDDRGKGKACVNALIKARFSQPMDLSTINDNNVKVYRCSSSDFVPPDTLPDDCITEIEGNISTGEHNNSQSYFTFTPEADLSANTWYKVVLNSNSDTGIKAANTGYYLYGGNPYNDQKNEIEATYEWYFQTRDSDKQCNINCVLVLPDPYVAMKLNQQVPYRALPQQEDNACISIDGADYEWRWNASEYLTCGNYGFSDDCAKVGDSCAVGAQSGVCQLNNNFLRGGNNTTDKVTLPETPCICKEIDGSLNLSVCHDSSVNDICDEDGDENSDNCDADGDGVEDGYCLILDTDKNIATALDETELNNPVIISAEEQTWLKEGNAELDIHFPFNVEEEWPVSDCEDVCLNADIGARFSSVIGADSLNENGAEKVYLYRCTNPAPDPNNAVNLNTFECSTWEDLEASTDFSIEIIPVINEANSKELEFNITDNDNYVFLFEPYTVYKAVLVGGEDGIKSIDGSVIDNGNDSNKVNYEWLFATGETVCEVTDIDVRPDPGITTLVGYDVGYQGIPYNDMHLCIDENTERAQRLRGEHYNWTWEPLNPPDDDLVAKIPPTDEDINKEDNATNLNGDILQNWISDNQEAEAKGEGNVENHPFYGMSQFTDVYAEIGQGDSIFDQSQTVIGEAEFILQCGWTKDAQCIDALTYPPTPMNNTYGVGNNSCCYPRPWVEAARPVDGAENICRNALLSARFNEAMDVSSFQTNVMVAAKYEANETCPEGMSYLLVRGENETSKFAQFIKNIIKSIVKPIVDWSYNPLWQWAVDKVSALSAFKALGALIPSARAENFSEKWCVVDGTVSGYNEYIKGESKGVATFAPNELMPTIERQGAVASLGREHILFIRGDEDLTDENRTGARNAHGVSMGFPGGTPVHGTLCRGNSSANQCVINSGQEMFGHIIRFTTIADKRDAEGKPLNNKGICIGDHIRVEEPFWLFQTRENDTRDDDAGVMYDSISDADKQFVATMMSADGQALTGVVGYDWEWEWSSRDTSVITVGSKTDYPPISDNSNTGDDDPNRSMAVVAGTAEDREKTFFDAQASIVESWVLDELDIPTNNDGTRVRDITGSAQIMVFLCENPWPVYIPGNPDWPYIDVNKDCTAGDLGGCYNTNFEFYYCRDQGGEGTADDLPAIDDYGSIRGMSDDAVKEFLFSRSGPPTAQVLTLNETILSWDVVASVSKYKLFYGKNSGSYTNIIDVTNTVDPLPPSDSLDINTLNLEDGYTYYFAIKAYSEDGAESEFSNEIEYALESVINKPTNVHASAFSGDRSVVLKWDKSEKSGKTDPEIDGYRIYLEYWDLGTFNDETRNVGDVDVYNWTMQDASRSYYFQISALRGEEESERTDPVRVDFGPVGWWKIDENKNRTIFDYSRFKKNGEASSPISWVNGFLDFNGVNNYIEVFSADNLSLASAAGFTQSVWINPDLEKFVKDPNNYYTIISSGDAEVDRYPSIYIHNKNEIHFGFGITEAEWCNATTDDDHLNLIKNDDYWYNIALAYDYHKYDLYLNGKHVKSYTPRYESGHKREDDCTRVKLVDTSELMIGADIHGQHFIGNIADVKIYNHVRTAGQIADDYNNSKWRFLNVSLEELIVEPE